MQEYENIFNTTVGGKEPETIKRDITKRKEIFLEKSKQIKVWYNE